MKDGELDPTITPTQAEATEPRFRDSARSEIAGYELREVIGRGGMGEVIAAHDPRTEREVALKRMRFGSTGGDTTRDEATVRFLREAKIQARLDHPAIVPVHEIGRDAEGAPYFTMKRLTGTTLLALLERGEPQQRLLRALVDVCLAVELAHSREIVHRDLKPSNIMLGDYGEVYVLDWGVARDLAQPERLPSGDSDGGVGTQVGQLLGTPGYMPPEQARGDVVGPPADVYALGAILFEILAGEALHPRGPAAIISTLANLQLSPAERRPERSIPPELDEACRDALATEPEGRPTARELGDRIQRYLDGDRDVERRRALAIEELAVARAALAGGDRPGAIRKANRALALDPDATDATDFIMELTSHEPEELPPELAATIARAEDGLVAARSRRAIAVYITGYIAIPCMMFLDVENVTMLVALLAVLTVMLALGWYNTRHRLHIGFPLVGHFILAAVFSQLASPLMLTPVVLSLVLLSMTSRPWLNDRLWFVLLWTVLAVMTPFFVEWIGLMPETWHMSPGGVTVHGTIFGTRSGPLLVAGNLITLLAVALYARNIGRDRRLADRRLHIQAWNFRQLLPQQASARQ